MLLSSTQHDFQPVIFTSQQHMEMAASSAPHLTLSDNQSDPLAIDLLNHQKKASVNKMLP